MSGVTLEQLSREIHIWVIELTQKKGTLSMLKELLDKKELNRLNQYVFYRDKRRFIVSRSILKEIIGRIIIILMHPLVFIQKKMIERIIIIFVSPLVFIIAAFFFLVFVFSGGLKRTMRK